jgi:hypothetical protein
MKAKDRTGKTHLSYYMSVEEAEQISYISRIYGISNSLVVKNLFYNRMTLRDFYNKTRLYYENQKDDVDYITDMDISKTNKSVSIGDAIFLFKKD